MRQTHLAWTTTYVCCGTYHIFIISETKSGNINALLHFVYLYFGFALSNYNNWVLFCKFNYIGVYTVYI